MVHTEDSGNEPDPLPQVQIAVRIQTAFLSAVLFASQGVAQVKDRPGMFDSTYVRDYSRQLTVRLFANTKYNALTLVSDAATDLVYRPNNRINIGVGASYRALTLNIGFGIPFLNDDDAVRGKTKYLDAQANIHSQRWAINMFLQRFSGYYISSYELVDLGWQQQTERPYRRDLVQYNLGTSALRILNGKRFSYRASFNQDAWQRRSQGSFLVGGYLTYYNFRADSTLVPMRLQDRFAAGSWMRRGDLTDVGPMAGYAFTYVLKEHWFLTLSAAVGAGLNVQRIALPIAEGEQIRTFAGAGWHGQWRAALGYNSRRTYIGLLFNQENVGLLGAGEANIRWNVGNVRLNFVHRFKQRMRTADRGIRWFKKKVVEPIKFEP